jgi:hypothetical protein
MQPIKRGVVKLARRQKRIQDGDVTLETLRRAWIMLLPQWAKLRISPGDVDDHSRLRHYAPELRGSRFPHPAARLISQHSATYR